MKKHIIDLRVTGTERVGAQCVLLRMVPVEGALPETAPGQFVQLRVDAPGVFLRRPISIHDVRGNEIDFLVQVVGEGTAWLGALKVGDTVNAVMPLGKGFTIEIKNEKLKIKNDGNENQNSPRSSLLRREWGLAPLCGAAATFSGYSKDPQSPLSTFSRWRRGRGSVAVPGACAEGEGREADFPAGGKDEGLVAPTGCVPRGGRGAGDDRGW